MKNLPIKLFQKRTDFDDRLPEGAGGNELPPWANLTPEDLNRRVASLKSSLEDIREDLLQQQPELDFIPALVQLKLHRQATAKSHRGDIASLFDVNNKNNVIGVVGDHDILVKVHNIDDVSAIERNIDRSQDNKKGIAAVTEINKFRPDIQVENPSASDLLRVSLVNFHNFQLNQSVCASFEGHCRARNIAFKKANYTPDLIVYRVSNVTPDTLEGLADFRAMESLVIMPTYTIGFDEAGDIDANAIEIKQPRPGQSYPVLGILDSGIARIPHLAPWVLPDGFSKVPADRLKQNHGTFVSGIAVYADQLEGLNHVGSDGCYLYDATVMPDPAIESLHEDDLIEHIREAIEANRDSIKIWNLSLGTRVEADLNTFSLFGMALDQIQSANDVLIVKSAGNCDNFLYGRPVSRISRSADSVLSLVIGSVAQAKGVNDLAEIMHPSPFSRIGKGPAFINKPDLTHLGGNAGIDALGRMCQSGVTSFAPNGGILKAIGTSFSTPRVASIIASLNHSINEPFNPLLLKALVLHSAKYPEDLAIPPHDRIKYMGYGIPAITQDILYNDPNEITLVLQDTLTQGNWVQMMDFPFPPEMIDNGYFYGEVIITLVSAPILSETQGCEYCQSNLLVRFGTHDGVRRREGHDERSDRRIRNRLDTTGPMNLLSGGLYKAAHRKATAGQFARERTLIEYEQKFHPVKKYAINLEELTPANREKYTAVPKHWYLEVEDLYRLHTIERSVIDGVQLSQDYCLIVTIRDNRKQHNVYDRVSQLLAERNFLHSNVRVNEQARVVVGR